MEQPLKIVAQTANVMSFKRIEQISKFLKRAKPEEAEEKITLNTTILHECFTNPFLTAPSLQSELY